MLGSKKLLKVVEGDEILPSTPPATLSGYIRHTPATGAGSKEEWYDKDTNALSIITSCLELSQVCNITTKTSSKAAWDELCRLYEAHDSITKMYLREQLFTLKMKSNDNMTKHLHAFRALLDQLSTTGSPMSDEDSVLSLMQSMPLSYSNFLISI